METRCRRSDREVQRYKALESAGVAMWRHRALEPRCRRADFEVRRYELLEAGCRRVDVEAWRCGALEF